MASSPSSWSFCLLSQEREARFLSSAHAFLARFSATQFKAIKTLTDKYTYTNTNTHTEISRTRARERAEGGGGRRKEPSEDDPERRATEIERADRSRLIYWK